MLWMTRKFRFNKGGIILGYSHGEDWSNKSVEDEIRNVMKVLNINRMPSNSEIKAVIGNYSLSNKITRTGGFTYWANNIGLDLKTSDTKLGNEWEIIVKNELQNKGYIVEETTVKCPYDLLINGCVKIDVKVSNFVRDYNYYTFNIGKKYPTCDIFICIGVKDNDIKKELIIPSKYLMGMTQLSVGENSKYDKFDNQFKYIDIYNDFYKSV